MASCGNERFLFLHVPKTGGSWAYKAMKAAGVELQSESTKERPHPDLSELDRRGRFTFAFVREPLPWYGSTWSFRRKRRYREDNVIDPYLELDFPDFLSKVIDTRPGFLGWYYQTFVGRFNDPIDFIGRHERLEDDLCQALRLADQDFDEEVLRGVAPDNRSDPPPPCPREVRERLVEAEWRVYERFYPAMVRSGGT
jgi:hypothetical protein